LFIQSTQQEKGAPVMLHETSLKTRYYETDAMGHINNTNYIAYLEVARVDFLYGTGISSKDKPFRFVVASVRCDYLHPIYPWQDIRITSWVSRIGNKSITMRHEILTEDGVTAAKAQVVMVRYDPAARQSLPLDPETVGKLRPYLRQDEAEK